MRKEWSYCLAEKTKWEGGLRKGQYRIIFAALLWAPGEKCPLFFWEWLKNVFVSMLRLLSNDWNFWLCRYDVQPLRKLIAWSPLLVLMTGCTVAVLCRRKRGKVPGEPVAKKNKIWCKPNLVKVGYKTCLWKFTTGCHCCFTECHTKIPSALLKNSAFPSRSSS